MNESILVDLHCHSHFSDGALAPEVLAVNLAAAGVRYAALTDHDTVDGLEIFQDALKKRGVGYISGVELTTQFNEREAHLLGYGFNQGDHELLSTLVSLRQVKSHSVHSIAESIRKAGSGRKNGSDEMSSPDAAPNGLLDIEDAIGLIHRAGGRTFWAHPWVYEPNLDVLDGHLESLKAIGLDGVEAACTLDSNKTKLNIVSLANKHELLISCGTDFHSSDDMHYPTWGVKMEMADWVKFRNEIFNTTSYSGFEVAANPADTSTPVLPESKLQQKPHFRRRSYFLRILIPTFIAILLFLVSIWGIILPSFEQTLLDRKREMIRELTNSAWSILSSYELDERNGLISREEAQVLAISRIEDLRYGAEGKDYFWLQDMTPRMVMHPYRPDLNGKDLHGITDPLDVHIFVEFANLVRRDGEGYIHYVWQWKDDPQRLEPKQSFVKGFSPWGWIIGTGIYMDDVTHEISRIEQNLINTSLVISGLVVLLLVFVLQQSLRIEKERQEVLDNLHDSTERYHSLVEATTEGTLLILENRMRYANPTFLSMLGYSSRQFELLDIEDLLPDLEVNSRVRDLLREDVNQPSRGEGLEGCLRKFDGKLLECVLTVNPIRLGGQSGNILLAKDVTRQSEMQDTAGLSQAVNSIPVGIFRAIAGRRGVFLDMNQFGKNLLSTLEKAFTPQPALGDLFLDADDLEEFLAAIQHEDRITGRVLSLVAADGSIRYISLSAVLVRDEKNRPVFIDGIFEDITTESKKAAGREALIERLQSSLLFLHEPLSTVVRDVVILGMDTSIKQLSRLMTKRNVTAALVASESGTVIGIVTDQDLRARVLAENIDLNRSIHNIMSSPLIKIGENARIYEALILMEEKGVRHLAVEDHDGEIVNVIDNKALFQYPSYGPIVLTRQLLKAESPEEISQLCGRKSPLIRVLMESSARPRHITDMLASIYDAATRRLIELAIHELGKPPARFAFIAMGSQGRQEPTMLTDQDNGIIYVLDEGGDPETISRYFQRLGGWVCEGLSKAGYMMCRGRVMASNPRWCRSLGEWLAGFDEWIGEKELQEIIDLSIFFDFRTIYGDDEISHEMRRYIHISLAGEPSFLNHFARNTLTFKPPLRLPGNIYLGGGTIEHVGEINLKDAMMTIVSFARLYALCNQVFATHTIDRIESLADKKVIQANSRDEISTAYNFLMELRLRNQLDAIQNGHPPTNEIQTNQLDHIQRELLKQAFVQISAIQKKIGYDFPGGG